MRTDKEMLELIVGFAKRDERIRAVQMLGSRTNPRAVRDRFQDFDICYYVNELETFAQGTGWLNYFGETRMARTREVKDGEGIYFLFEMLFTDGNKIDLMVKPTEMFTSGGDSMLLLSKDKLTAVKEEETESETVTPPVAEAFNQTCANFWWAVQYVAKGIARDQLTFATHYLNNVMRPELYAMLEWETGESRRFFKQHLEHEQYRLLKKTFAGGEYQQVWESLFDMCELFREAAAEVASADGNGFEYSLQTDEAMTEYLREVEKDLTVKPQKAETETVKIKVPKLQREYMPYGSVLVVDDMETNLYVTRGILNLYGLNVDTATSGAQAIEKITENRDYDMVFMDHLMPDMDGITAANAILEKGYTGPLVALTANNAMGQEEIFISTGFDAFLSKPIDAAQLNALLNKYIRDKQPPEVLAEARAEMVRRADEKRRSREQTVTAGLIAVFVLDAEKAIEALQSFDGNDLHHYVINAHAMKSTLNVMGEEELSEWASRLEDAGQAGNIDLLTAETPGFVKELSEVADKYRKQTK